MENLTELLILKKEAGSIVEKINDTITVLDKRRVISTNIHTDYGKLRIKFDISIDEIDVSNFKKSMENIAEMILEYQHKRKEIFRIREKENLERMKDNSGFNINELV